MRRVWVVLLVPSMALGGVDPFANESEVPTELADVELEEWLELPISSVSLRDEKASQAPAAVFVLSGDDVREQGFRTLGEILRTVPGLFVVPDSAYFNIGTRGLSLPGDQNTRFLVMIDGQPVNNAVGLGQSYIDRELPIGPQALERIEVIQGPIGGVYGPVAFMGVVNFVTKKPRGLAAEVMAAGEANSLGISGGEVAGTVSGRLFDKLEVLAHVGGYRSRGGTFTAPEWRLFDDRPVPADLTVRGSDWLLAENVFVKLGWEDLSLTAGYAHRKRNIATYPYAAIIGDTTLYYENQNVFTSLAWEKRSQVISVLLRGGYQEADYSDDLGFDDGSATPPRFRDFSFDRWLSGEARLSFTPISALRAVAGGLAQHHWTDQRYGFSTETPKQSPIAFATLNLYALLEWRPLGDRLMVQAGVSWAWHGLYGSQLSPRLAATLQVTESTTAKLLLTSGFRNQTLFEGNYDDGQTFVPNASLSGDSSVSIEGSLEQQLGHWARVGVTLFDTSYDRLISQRSVLDETLDGLPGPGAGDVSSSYVNLPSFQVHGAQLFVDVHHSRVRLWGGVSVQDTRSITALRLPGFSNLTANFTVSTNAPYKPLTLAFSGILIGPRLKATASLVPGSSAEVPWGGSFQVTARLALPWVKGLTLQLSLQNVLAYTLSHPVQGDYAPLTTAPEPELLGRALLEWKY